MEGISAFFDGLKGSFSLFGTGAWAIFKWPIIIIVSIIAFLFILGIVIGLTEKDK